MAWSKEKKNAYMKERYLVVRAAFIARLGGRCVQCGSDEDLEFDHIDPTTKKFTISKLWSNTTACGEELKKCQLLCKSCHLSKTLGSLPPLAHGTPGMYGKRKCRCGVCRSFNAQYRLKYRPALARGRRPRKYHTGE